MLQRTSVTAVESCMVQLLLAVVCGQGTPWSGRTNPPPLADSAIEIRTVPAVASRMSTRVRVAEVFVQASAVTSRNTPAPPAASSVVSVVVLTVTEPVLTKSRMLTGSITWRPNLSYIESTRWPLDTAVISEVRACPPCSTGFPASVEPLGMLPWTAPWIGRLTVLNVATATAHGSAVPTVADGDDPAIVASRNDALTNENRPAGVVGFNWPLSFALGAATLIVCAAVPSPKATKLKSFGSSGATVTDGEVVAAALVLVAVESIAAALDELMSPETS